MFIALVLNLIMDQILDWPKFVNRATIGEVFWEIFVSIEFIAMQATEALSIIISKFVEVFVVVSESRIDITHETDVPVHNIDVVEVQPVVFHEHHVVGEFANHEQVKVVDVVFGEVNVHCHHPAHHTFEEYLIRIILRDKLKFKTYRSSSCSTKAWLRYQFLCSQRVQGCH